ncbi:MAG: NAD(P)-dependent alcohol dehydrogenase [Oscillospiraceae bacterium]|nr:NAD(P)-dependent alcohol dehydrogenase [Oscillospiraceae bacterium]
MKIKAAIVKSAGGPLTIEDIDLAAPQNGELLIQVVACGFCHTDELARIQAVPVPLPAVLGHEGCGIVTQTGSGVSDFAIGDKVAISFGYCGTCMRCLAGMPTLCESFGKINFGGTQSDGTSRLAQNGKPLSALFAQATFATHAVVHERSVVKIPDDIPLEITAPLGCGIQTGAGAVLNRLKPRPGTSIVVLGCGSVGLSAIMAAKIAGCDTIIGVDVISSRLEMALNLGATHVINSMETSDVAEAVRTLTRIGADASIDTTGKSACTRMALHCIRSGASAVIVGGGREMTLDIEMDLMSVGKSLIGVVEGDSHPKIFIPELLAHYKAGRFPFDKMIEYYDFEDIGTAMEDTLSGKTIKAVLRMT